MLLLSMALKTFLFGEGELIEVKNKPLLLDNLSDIHKHGCYNNPKCGLQQKNICRLSRMFSVSGDISNSLSGWLNDE